jgi:molecular chaperone GrpE
MRGKKDNVDAKDTIEEMNTDLPRNGTEAVDVETPAAGDEVEAIKRELEAVRTELDEKAKKCEEYLNMLQRTAAEFDNYKKRTAREKEALYSEAVSDVAASILPVVDNMERALQACSREEDFKVLKEGIEMVNRQFREAMKNVGIEEIRSLNENFDPQLHNAVMHVEDESVGQNVVVEEFQKGYIYKDKVIRHSMVKVAN